MYAGYPVKNEFPSFKQRSQEYYKFNDYCAVVPAPQYSSPLY